MRQLCKRVAIQNAIFGRRDANVPAVVIPDLILQASTAAMDADQVRHDEGEKVVTGPQPAYDNCMSPLAIVLLVLATVAAMEGVRSEEHTSELQSLMRISYAVFGLKKKNLKTLTQQHDD